MREAFAAGLVEDGEGWMQMIRSRNQTSHTYNQTVVNEIVGNVLERYHRLFLAFEATLAGLPDG